MQTVSKLILYFVLGYATFCVALFFLQRGMLYLPSTTKISAPVAGGEGLSYWPSIDDFKGFIAQDEPSDVKGTVIVFHGNAGAAYHRLFYTRALSRQNLRVILAEYPGYGGRSGKPSETVLVKDAVETIERAYQEYGEPLYLWGESLGSGVICNAITKTTVPIAGMVLFTPWDSLPRLAQTHYWYLPAQWLVMDQYNNVKNVQGYTGNVAVILAGEDEVVPSKHGKRLYDAITTTKKLWLFEDTRHNEMPLAPDLAWWKEVVDFISQQRGDQGGQFLK